MQSQTEQTGSDYKTSPQSVEIEEIGSEADLQACWPVLRRQYLAMLRRGAGDTLTEDDILDGIRRCEYTMIVGLKDGRICGSCIYRFERRGIGLACQVIGIAGWNMDDWKDPFCDYMDDVCEKAGAYCLETFARSGTAKQLKDRGWRVKATLMEKRYGRQ